MSFGPFHFPRGTTSNSASTSNHVDAPAKCMFCGGENWMVDCEVRVALLAAEREKSTKEVVDAVAGKAKPVRRSEQDRKKGREVEIWGRVVEGGVINGLGGACVIL
ncbi:hypothetical protein MBM_08433 [Drepanopeziza brunnea f. sp. 'multigermtubi' MB_m1]|uniref:Uncharacterized protein n=1 Tax=Marssonina brunnea f. sp. multigermtubi (strain MB_m1) TaxID=1072389 RepID=K1W857_MARBU|nr:uncharacterized protein MBM_08433 [Drepanopeziza brunnea f. sp. 'multigermtubi' MB_m1]EKD13350.1 hypothetical protein MBM_08433 [Drepanopeziza brunnea f. sp. 'multigermtubi' MB_m1]